VSYDDTPHPADRREPPRGFNVAVRERHFGRVGIEGPKGAGKTRLAIQWARILAGDNPVAVIDTEDRRAAAYAPAPGEAASERHWSPPWEFWHHCWSGPFVPDVLVRRAEMAAEAVGPDGTVVVDSLSPFWSGRGGVQDIVDSSPSGWKVGGPVHRDMLDALGRLPCHLICTMRSKTEWVVEEKDVGGRTVHVVRMLGKEPDQRMGIHFEFEIMLTLDADHHMSATASSCPPEFTVVAAPPTATGAFAEAYATWIGGGIERIARSDVNVILAKFDEVDDRDHRATMKQDFANLFGAPEDILAERAPEAIEWVNARVMEWLAPPAPPSAEPPPVPIVAEQPTLPNTEEEVVVPAGDGLEDRDKADLVRIAQTMGVPIDGRWGAGRIAGAIREFTAEADDDADTEVTPV
jgi:hypothetical protein